MYYFRALESKRDGYDLDDFIIYITSKDYFDSTGYLDSHGGLEDENASKILDDLGIGEDMESIFSCPKSDKIKSVSDIESLLINSGFFTMNQDFTNMVDKSEANDYE